MKKLLLTISAIGFIGVAANAQTIYSENFNATTGSSLPSGWLQTGGEGWQTGTNADLASSYFNFPDLDGKRLEVNDDADQNADNSDAFVQTGSINLSTVTSNVYAKFNLIYLAASGTLANGTPVAESLTLEASTDGGATWNVLQTLEGTPILWQYEYIDVSSVAGNANVMFGFRYKDDGQWLYGAAIDNFSILRPSASNLELLAATPLQGTDASYGAVSTNKDIIGYLFNHGTAAASYVVKYQQGTNPVVSSIPFNVAPFTYDTFTHNVPFMIPSEGDFPIKVWVEVAGDVDHSNDSADAYVVGVANMPTKRLVFEENTCTKCTWCPRGTVGMDEFAASHPGVAAQIAVHDNFQGADPMAAPDDYISLVTGSPDYPGNPSIYLDRKLYDDPGSVEDIYNAHLNDFGYADVTLGSVNISGSTVSIPVTITPATEISGAKLALVVTEGNVTGTASGYDQVNAYSGGGQGAMGGFESYPSPVPAANLRYHFVARSISPSAGGDASGLPATMASASSNQATLTTTLNAAWNPDNLQYIVLLIGSNGQVLNSNFSELPDLDSFLYSGVTSVSNLKLGVNTMEVYPNPSSGHVNVIFDMNKSAKANIYVNDITGRTIYSTPANLNNGKNEIQIPGSTFNDGVYFINATFENGKSAVLKLIIKH